VNDLRKVLAYANLLASGGEVSWEDLTVTIIRTGESRAVLDYLRGKEGVRINEEKGKETGIWEIRGYMDLRIQIVQSEKLPEEEHR